MFQHSEEPACLSGDRPEFSLFIFDDEGLEVIFDDGGHNNLRITVSIHIRYIEGEEIMLISRLTFSKEAHSIPTIFTDIEVMFVHDHNFVLFVSVHIADIKALDFKVEGLTFFELRSLRANPSDIPPGLNDGRISGVGRTSGHGTATDDSESDILCKISDFCHHIINTLVLGIDTKRRLILCDTDETGIQADVVSDLRDASENNIGCSGSCSNLLCHIRVETNGSHLIENSLHDRPFDDNDSAFHGDP